MQWKRIVNSIERRKPIITIDLETNIRKCENNVIKGKRNREMRKVKRIQNERIRNLEEDRLYRKWHRENKNLETKRVKEDVIASLKKRLSKQRIKKKLEESTNLRKLQRSIILKKLQALKRSTT